MRRMLFVLVGAAMGAAFLTLFSAADGALPQIGVAVCALFVVAAAIGGRWGPGPVARGVQDRHFAVTGLLVVALSVVAGLMLLRWPAMGAGLPRGRFVLCMAVAGLLMVPVGLMGRPRD